MCLAYAVKHAILAMQTDIFVPSGFFLYLVVHLKENICVLKTNETRIEPSDPEKMNSHDLCACASGGDQSLSRSSVVPGLKGTYSHAPRAANFPWECKNVPCSAG